MKHKTYYIHALLGYSRHSYRRFGPYRFGWFAKMRAHMLIGNHPFGEAVITGSPDQPKMVDERGEQISLEYDESTLGDSI